MIVTFCRITTIGLIVLIGLLCSTTPTSMADVLEDALIAAWLFDENGGDTAGDASGNGHDGKIIGQNGSRARREGLSISMETAISWKSDTMRFSILLNTRYRRGLKRIRTVSGKPCWGKSLSPEDRGIMESLLRVIQNCWA